MLRLRPSGVISYTDHFSTTKLSPQLNKHETSVKQQCAKVADFSTNNDPSFIYLPTVVGRYSVGYSTGRYKQHYLVFVSYDKQTIALENLASVGLPRVYNLCEPRYDRS